MSLGFPPPRQPWTEVHWRFLSRVWGLSSNVVMLLLSWFFVCELLQESLRWPGFPQKLQTCVVFFRSLFYSSGVFFPEALASGLVRGWDLKPVFLVVLGRFFPFFGGRFVLYLVRLKPFVQFVSLVFPSIRTCGRNQRFRCFCGSVGQRNPRSRSPFALFFLPFLPFCPLRLHIRSVSRLRDTKCSLQQRASMTDIKERNAEIALCSDRCWFYYNGMNYLLHSFGVILPCRKRWLFSATIISWREFFRA